MYYAVILLALMSGQVQKFEVDGEIVSPDRQQFRWVQIESIDRRFVDNGEIDSGGRFILKNIPEGLYKLIVIAKERDEQRTIEVRPAFADSRARVVVKLELPDTGGERDRYKV